MFGSLFSEIKPAINDCKLTLHLHLNLKNTRPSMHDLKYCIYHLTQVSQMVKSRDVEQYVYVSG